MNAAVELHDSQLANVDIAGSNVRLSLRPAYIHRSVGTPGVDSGTGWIQDIDFVVEKGLVTGELGRLPAELGGGELRIDGKSIRNVLPVPLNQAGQVDLKLELMWGGAIHVSGSRISIELLSDAKYVEDFRVK